MSDVRAETLAIGQKPSAHGEIKVKRPTLGFIGFGEVTYHLIKGLQKEGFQGIKVFSRSVFDPRKKIVSAQKAREIDAVLSGDLSEIMRGADIVISSVRGHVAFACARKAARHIRPGQLYVDLNNAIPSVKKRAAKIINSQGGQFVDVGLLELPIQVGHNALMYASGEGAEAFQEIFSPYGMNIRVIPGGVGKAALIKALANIYMKGLQGVCLEFAVSARKAGISLELLEPLLVKPVVNLAREKDVALWIIRGALLAERKKAEMAEALKMMRELKINPIMLRAAVKRLGWIAGFKLPEYFDAGLHVGEYEKIIDKLFAIGQEKKKAIK
jgi:3-hydroxyisobutyrate dehydrogenase-like beta-hydroxyacid dehydrogenase